jgi:hypothetical protein
MYFKNIFQKLVNKFGFKIGKNFKIIPLFKKNVFKTKYKKRVLLSYITEPFVMKNAFSHTNTLECFIAAEIFNELGFCVDVANFNSDKKINYKKYDVIYGMGKILENSFYVDKPNLTRMFYATGCNPTYSNNKTILKVRKFRENHNKLIIKSSRFIEKSTELQTLLSDRVVVLGNQLVLNTYTDLDVNALDRYKNLNAFYYDAHDTNSKNKDYSIAKKHFLWFGSTGLLHKGLDLLIDIFSKRDDIFLHICGAPESENEFFEYYSPILSKSKNIINHGFVDIKSEEYIEITNKCAFTIAPSVSEGGAASTLNTIANGGLIPIITKYSGLDVEEFGLVIEEPIISCVQDAIEKAEILSNENLINMSRLATEQIRSAYSHKNYKDNLTKIIKESII